MSEVRVVLNQCGAALELHGVADNPVTLLLLSPNRLAWYREQMSEDNHDMQHASIGQVAMFAAKRLTNGNLSPYLWQYNASDDRYSRC